MRQAGAREVGARQIASLEVQIAEVAAGEAGPRAAGAAAREQPVALDHVVDVALRQLAQTKRGRAEVARKLVPRGMLGDGRSEEHTSELQSLMRLSYAVFCL